MRLDRTGVPLLHPSRQAVQVRAGLAAASVLALLLAAGCANSGSPGGSVSSTVVIASVPGVSDASIYLAQKDGLFAAAGLAHVQIKRYRNQAAEMAALSSAQADIAASDYGDVFNQQAQSHDLRILADGYDATSSVLEILTLPNSSITEPKDLIGDNVKIGLPSDDILSDVASDSAPSLYAAAATNVLTDYVGTAEAGLIQGEWQPESQQAEVAGLKDGSLQAILVSEPYIYEAESELGAVEVLDACSGPTAGLPLLGYVAMNAWVRDNPGAAADFQAAIAKAQSDASLAGQVQAVLPGATGMTAQDADLVTVGTYPTSTSTAGLEEVVRLLAVNGTISNNNPPAVPPMIVNSKG
jgi:NitT/TauT family transport system substrate-binding protein